MESLPVWFSGLLAVLLLTSFVKILTTLSIVRFGLGLEGAGFGAVIAGVALVLSFMVVTPQLEPLGGIEGLLSAKFRSDAVSLEIQFRPFLEKHADKTIVERFTKLSERLKGAEAKGAATVEGQTSKKTSFPVLVSAFLISELREAFKLGLLFIIPFLVIDLVVANTLLALGVTQMPYSVLSLPLKLLLFLVADGWALMSEKLVGTYLS